MKGARKGSVLGSASGGAEKRAEERFGALEAVLGVILAACANDKVGQQCLIQYSPLTNVFLGSRYGRKKV